MAHRSLQLAPKLARSARLSVQNSYAVRPGRFRTRRRTSVPCDAPRDWISRRLVPGDPHRPGGFAAPVHGPGLGISPHQHSPQTCTQRRRRPGTGTSCHHQSSSRHRRRPIASVSSKPILKYCSSGDGAGSLSGHNAEPHSGSWLKTPYPATRRGPTPSCCDRSGGMAVHCSGIRT